MNAYDPESLATRQEFYDLALKYARAADRRDYALFEQIFTPDIAITGDRDGKEFLRMQGREQVVKGMSGLERYEVTQHTVANQLVEWEGDEASGETYCVAHHIYEADGEKRIFTMGIRYQDRFAREQGRWFFRSRHLAVDWERHAPLGEGPTP